MNVNTKRIVTQMSPFRERLEGKFFFNNVSNTEVPNDYYEISSNMSGPGKIMSTRIEKGSILASVFSEEKFGLINMSNYNFPASSIVFLLNHFKEGIRSSQVVGFDADPYKFDEVFEILKNDGMVFDSRNFPGSGLGNGDELSYGARNIVSFSGRVKLFHYECVLGTENPLSKSTLYERPLVKKLRLL